jgi:predicted small metal-binding protein
MVVTYLIVAGQPGRHRRRPTMAKVIRCECGYVANGESDDEVVDAIRAHMATDHPALLESVSRDDLREWIEHV